MLYLPIRLLLFMIMLKEIPGLKAEVRRGTIVFPGKGKYNPSLKLAWYIARVFGLPVGEVFSYE